MNIQFGSGVLYAKPTAGNQPSNPSPFKFGVLQECNVDFKADLKKLFGQYQFPVATARGKLECTIKGKLAAFDAAMLNQLYFAQTQTTGYEAVVDAETKTITANVATVSNVPVLTNWGVTEGVTGQPFIQVGAAPVAGQYIVNLTTGVYTFNGADNGKEVKISYTYNVSAAPATTVVIANQLMGYAPELSMLLYNRFRNKYMALQLNDVILGSISIPTKLEDFWVADFDGSANADASNVIGKLMLDAY